MRTNQGIWGLEGVIMGDFGIRVFYGSFVGQNFSDLHKSWEYQCLISGNPPNLHESSGGGSRNVCQRASGELTGRWGDTGDSFAER